MCDYSLHHVASRPAKVGDVLVTTQFWNTPTRGFSAVGEANVAVCLVPGTEVAFESEVRRELGSFEFLFAWKPWKQIRHKVACFRQIDLRNPHRHHDALEFPDGQIVLLTQLHAGQTITVLQLPAQPKTPVEKETDARTVEASIG